MASVKLNGEGGIRIRAAGYYPLDGLANRCSGNTTTEDIKTCKTSKEQLTPQLTPKSRKQGKIDILELPSDVAEIVAVWPSLPEHIKQTIITLARSV